MVELARRDAIPGLNHTMATLLVILLVLVITIVVLGGALLFLRQRAKARKAAELPTYSEKRLSTSSTHSHHRRNVSVRPSQSIHIYHEKREFSDASSSDSRPGSPTNSLPEIRVTFPEEIDASGKRQSGRVVVVHVGDTGVGLEPAEKLPSYQEGDRFDSIDLERVGGLEKIIEKSVEAGRPLGWR